MPAALRRALAIFLRAVSPEPAGTIARMAAPLLPARFNVRRAGDQTAKLARIIGSISLDDMYRELCSIDNDPEQTVLQGEEGGSWSADEMNMTGKLDPLDRMTLADSLSYLTDDILQKVDRAAMAVALETRVPFLDKDVVKFAMAAASGWSGSCSIGTSRKTSSTGRRPALAFRSTTGCAGP
jgi:asparagine synthase (glutamine-hydrolysing)